MAISKVKATEITYELHSLGWKAFQKLCSTIVAELWGQTIQTFFDSHDGGRDGAFNGTWSNGQNQTFYGSFTVQCKFTAKPDAIIKLSDLEDELIKAQRLADKGLADNYFLFTNAKLTGVNDEAIREKFENIPKLKKCHVYGGERICDIIHESKRLRMLVPRIYGLGDLGQILDERAYIQAQEILSSLGGDLNKFIITDAYRKSAKALVEHGFVLLLGEPMCGKSTIAAALSMGALDEWGCSTIKIRDADDFVKHFNPHEKQLFWVDDAFGATQFDWSYTVGWNSAIPHVAAAINKGSKIIFTSRNYIYESAKKCLKESALPVIKESQVVIRVENLTKEEKEQILYNHIRLGQQSSSYKTSLKQFLPNIASHAKFSPEIARRLGNPLFTKNLAINKYDVENFIEKPLEMLCEVINTIDDGSRAALALVFLRGGALPSPLQINSEEKHAIERLGGTIGDVTKRLEALNGSLLINSIKEGEHSWHFKHPTVRDAFAAIVASSQDLMDIYLTGAPLEKLFSEISCGDVGLKGASVIVPKSQYCIVIEKIKSFDTKKWSNKSALCRFLSYRCDKIFLLQFLESFPDFISQLSIGAYIYASSDVDVIARFHELNILPEEERIRFVSEIKELSVDIPDSGFLTERIRSFISDAEMNDIIEFIRASLLPYLNNKVNDWKSDYNGNDEPEAHFEELRGALNDYKQTFVGDVVAWQQIEQAIEYINKAIEDLVQEYDKHGDDEFFDGMPDNNHASTHNIRSIFDDVDA